MKKLNKFFAVLVALAMMATLCVCMAFAADPAYDATKEAVVGSEENPAHGYLTKTLQMPEGTTTPDADFTFDFQEKTGDGLQTGADETKLEDTLEFDGETGQTGTDGIKKVVKNYDFANVAAFTKAGRYQFDVVETENTNAAIDADTAQTLKYSKEKYLVTIDVANKADGSGLYIRNIAVQKYNTDGTLGAKVNPTVPTGGEGSDFNYTNTYVKNLPTNPDGGDPTDPDNPSKDNTGLFVEKEVKGLNDADPSDADKAAQFTFTVKVTAPSLSDKTSYKAKVVDTNATDKTAAVDVTTTAAKDSTTKELTFTSGTEATVVLKHGYRLVFEDLDVGAKYEVAETADAGYSTKYVKTENGTAAQAAEGLAIAETKITEGKDSAEYVNTNKNSDTPTGILINNLPYIALALVAIGGLVAYVVVRRRQSDEA